MTSKVWSWVKRYRYRLLLSMMIVIGFGRWFGPGVIARGDWFYLNPVRISEFAYWPQLFEESYGITSFLGLSLYSTPLRFMIGLSYTLTHLNFGVLSLIFYFGFSLFLTVVGMWLLARRVWQSERAAFLAATLYLFNSYALIIFIGGQLLGAVSYGFIPWIILALDRLMEQPSTKRLLILVFILQGQILYDPRFMALTLPIIGVWLFARRSLIKPHQRKFWSTAFKTMLISGLFNLYWLYGVFGVKGSDSGIVLAGYDNVGWVRSLSYATLKHAFLLHHVWWPSSSLGVKYDPNIIYLIIIFFIIVSLGIKKYRSIVWPLFILAIGAIFLAKGSNPPGGYIYEWLFNYAPGFKVFRDPAKFFTIIAFCYSLLFAVGWDSMATLLNKFRRSVNLISIALFVALFGFSNLSVWNQKIEGTLAKNPYVQAVPDVFAEYSTNRENPTRVLWVPRIYRYPYLTNQQATLDANTLQYTTWKDFPKIEGVEKLAHNRLIEFLLQANNISLVAIPGDSQNDIFAYTSRTRDGYVDDWRSLEIFDEEKTVTDLFNDDTTIFHYGHTLGPVFASKRLVVTQDSSIESFHQSIMPNVTDNALALLTDEQAKKTSYLEHAGFIYLTPKHDLSQLDAGVIQWKIAIPKDGNYTIFLPDQKSGLNYSFDGAVVKPVGTRAFNKLTYQQFSFNNLAVGEHTIQLDFRTAGQAASIVPDLVTSSNLWDVCAGHSEVERPLTVFPINKKELDGQGIRFSGQNGIRACLRYVIPDDLKKGLFIGDFNGTNTGVGNAVNANFYPRIGQQYIFDEGKVEKLYPFYSDQNYDQLRIQINIGEVTPNSEILISHFRLYHVSSDLFVLDNVILQREDTIPVSEAKVTDFKRISEVHQTFKLADNTEGTVVTFSTGYDANIQLKHRESGQIISDHFNSDFGLNGWWVPANLNGEFDISFTPANKIYLASYISLVSVLVGLIVLIRIKWREVRAQTS